MPGSWQKTDMLYIALTSAAEAQTAEAADLRWRCLFLRNRKIWKPSLKDKEAALCGQEKYIFVWNKHGRYGIGNYGGRAQKRNPGADPVLSGVCFSG